MFKVLADMSRPGQNVADISVNIPLIKYAFPKLSEWEIRKHIDKHKKEGRGNSKCWCATYLPILIEPPASFPGFHEPFFVNAPLSYSKKGLVDMMRKKSTTQKEPTGKIFIRRMVQFIKCEQAKLVGQYDQARLKYESSSLKRRKQQRKKERKRYTFERRKKVSQTAEQRRTQLKRQTEMCALVCILFALIYLLVQ